MKMDPGEMECADIYWIGPTQDRDKWEGVLSTW
jgi:hypothetical protein